MIESWGFWFAIVGLIYSELVSRFEDKADAPLVAKNVLSAINRTTFLSLSGLAVTTSDDAMRFLRKVFFAISCIIFFSLMFIPDIVISATGSILVLLMVVLIWTSISGFSWQERKNKVLSETVTNAWYYIRKIAVMISILWITISMIEVFIQFYPVEPTQIEVNNILFTFGEIAWNMFLICSGLILLFGILNIGLNFTPAWISLVCIKLIIIFSQRTIKIGKERRLSICRVISFLGFVYFTIPGLVGLAN